VWFKPRNPTQPRLGDWLGFDGALQAMFTLKTEQLVEVELLPESPQVGSERRGGIRALALGGGGSLFLLLAGTALAAAPGRPLRNKVSHGEVNFVGKFEETVFPGDAEEAGVEGGVDELQAKAKKMLTRSKKLIAQAEDIDESVKKDKETIENALQKAEEFSTQADQHRKTALAKLKVAKELQAKAVKAKAVAQQNQDDAEERIAKADRLMQKGRLMERHVSEILAQARVSEENAREEVYFFRACVDLPGIKLKGIHQRDFNPLLPAAEGITSWDRCLSRCQKHTECRQAVWAAPDKECLLYHGATIEPLSFGVDVNSSYCGALESKSDMLDMVSVVIEKDPKDFGDPAQEIAPAKEDAAVQGTSLFCFTVVLAIEEQQRVADHMKQKQLGICLCDESLFVNSPATREVESAVEPFIKAWTVIGKEGVWRSHDWIVKVDPDAVFFPSRLKSHLVDLRTPEGAAVYIRNSEASNFQLIGTIEAMTREAMQLRTLRGERCHSNFGASPGEDGWLQWCLEAIGIDYQTDTSLLSKQFGDCGDRSAVAFPFHNSTKSWDKCHQQAKPDKKHADG